MSIQNDKILTSEMQRQPKLATYGNYKWQKLIPTLAIPSTITDGGDKISITLPPKCANHFFDRLEFLCTMTDVTQIDIGTPLTPNLVDAYNKQFTSGICPILRVEVVTQSSVILMDINDFNKFTNTTFKRCIPYTDVLTFDRLREGGLQALYEGLTLNNSDVVSILPYTAGVYENPNVDYLALREVIDDDTVNSTLPIRYTITMGNIKESIFSVCQDMNFNEPITINFYTAPATHVGFRSETIHDNIKSRAPTKYTLTDFSYYLAEQTNKDILDMVNNNPKQEILIPYVYGIMKPTPTISALNTYVLKFNKNHGKRILRTYYSPYYDYRSVEVLPDEQNGSLIYKQENYNSEMYSAINIIVNGDRIASEDYLRSNYTDYTSQKHLLKGSSIISMLEHYRYSGYIHNFSDNYPLCKEFDFDRKNWIVGTEVYSNYDIEWVITAGSKASFNYFWTVFQRKLIIDKIAGVYLSNN